MSASKHPAAICQSRPAAALADSHVVIELHALALCPYADIEAISAAAGIPVAEASTIISVGAAGVVTEMLNAKATHFTVGDEVWTRATIINPSTMGRITIPASQAFRLPVGVSLAQAATLGDSGLMALAALREGNIGSGSRLLIHGAANPFGNAAIALANYLGAEVIATVESNNQMEIALTAGATHVTLTRPRDAIPLLNAWAGDRGFDVILDSEFAEHLPLNAALLAKNGLIITCPLQGRIGAVHGFDALAAKNGQVRFLSHTTLEKHDLSEMAAQINDSIANGRHRPLIGQIIAPVELPDALERLARGRLIGNLVLKPEPASATSISA